MNYIYIGEIYDNTGIYIYIAHVAKLVAVSLKSALLANRIVYVQNRSKSEFATTIVFNYY